MNQEDLGRVRRAVLDRIERSERKFKLAIAAACLIEGVFLLAYLHLMDFHNSLHWLILIAAGLVYCTVGAGLFALGAYINLSTQRVLRSIELIETRSEVSS